MASLTLKNISKNFGPVKALSRVDLDVEDGEFCVLLGPSGCGKSTLLNIIAGLIPQDAGHVIMNHNPIDRLTPRERDVAVVFQSYALYPHMTVARNLSFGLRMRGESKDTIRQRVSETARLLGIQDLLNRKPRALSGGQRQRVAMGRALVRRPSLFLLDEPLSNLDARLRANVRLELKRLHQKVSGTIIYVTHDQVEAMTLGDKVVVMRDGRIHQVDRPEVIYASPADTFVASFIGTPEINLYSGELAILEDQVLFRGRGFTLHLGRFASNLEGKRVEVGIRPEDIRIADHSTPLRAKIEMISDIGSEKYVHALLGEEELTVRAPKDQDIRLGKSVALSIDPIRVHLFYRGRRISGPIQAIDTGISGSV